MSKINQLKPCPFCGSENLSDDHDPVARRVSCKTVGCAMYLNGVTVEQWNTRAAQPETSHAGDCTIYRSIVNGSPTDGICTCGYGWNRVRESDWSQMYSKELMDREVNAQPENEKEGR